MTVYVDEEHDYGDMVQGYARRWGTVWSHLGCGGDCEELHAFAARLGLKRAYAQHMDRPDHYYHHYDVVPSKRRQALSMGAVYRPAEEAALEHIKLRKERKATDAQDTA